MNLRIPGPTPCPDDVREAMSRQMINHRGVEFSGMVTRITDGLKQLFETRNDVLTLTASGTGAMESVVVNTLSPGDRVLVVSIGSFGDRFARIAAAYGADIEKLDFEWGTAAGPEAVAGALESGAHKAVFVTHNETATGVRSNVAAVRRAMDAAGHPALLLVDGVSSIACMDFRMDEWGVDIAVTGSQKGFMLPTGLAIVGASPKAIAAMERARLPRCFLDFRDMLNTNPKGGYPYTPPVNLLYGLGESLKMLEEEGLDTVFARHHRLAEGIRRAVAAWGMKLCAQSPELYSETVSAIVVPEGFDSTRIVTHAAEKYHVAFGVGLGEVAGKVFRIGHLGSLTDVMALSGIACAEMVMADLGLPIRLGSGVAAAQEYYRGTADSGLRQVA